jgi:endo-1,4-beta-D-glucanase Y
VKQGCGGYYVFSNGGTGADVGDEVSEGHGYGMVTTAIMAGHDPDAQKIFDGMYAFFRKFPSSHTPDLMGWTVNVGGGCKFPKTPSDSATDGDLDIAFSLLLADKLWGSAGAINYLAEAKKVIAAIMKFEVNPTTHLTNLGDWATATDYSTRPSDFMADHFHAYATAGGNAAAMAVVDAMFKVEATIQGSASMATGLMPDFVINTNTTAKPAAANFLEGPHDGDYDYNSCRNPWRIATHYIGWGDARAKTALAKTNTWIKTATGGDPKKIHDGYKLNGTSTSTGTDLSFEAPFGVAAMLGDDQAWLDAVWKDMVGQGIQSYYGDSIKMLSMIVMSGNWWEP